MTVTIPEWFCWALIGLMCFGTVLDVITIWDQSANIQLIGLWFGGVLVGWFTHVLWRSLRNESNG